MTVRRTLLAVGVGLAAAGLGIPLLASSRRAMAPMTDGPFYPPRAWRADWFDHDADLSRVRQRDGALRHALGEHLGLQALVSDRRGRLIDGAEVELWQCDARAAYRHPRVITTADGFDPGFQGWGAARSDAQGRVMFRTIRPVPYPGRTPHIHVKLRHASFGEFSTQLFVAGDPGNAGDFLWRGVAAADRAALEMQLQPADTDNGLRWQANHTLVVPV